MKVFYAAAIGGSSQTLDKSRSKEIPELLTKKGHMVNIYLYDPSDPDRDGAFDSVSKQIIEADVFIGEMSRASQTLGFQLSFALSNSKPCLYLYNKSTKGKPGAYLNELPNRLLKIKSYDNRSLEYVIDNFLEFAEDQFASSRTSFMSTKNIDRYITTRANQLGVSKGEVIRQILDRASKEQ